MLNFDTIVFPTDFSECSDQAFDYAVLLAEQNDAELHLLHAAVLLHDDPVAEKFPEEMALLDRLEEVTRSKLGAIVNKEMLAMLRVREARRRGFSASDVILDYADEVDADAIVMGTHGRRGPRRWLLGSVAEDVLRRARCPVLAVRQREDGHQLDAIGRVLVPIDFSERSAAAVEVGRDLAHLYEAKLTLLHVVDLPAVPTLYGQPMVADIAQIESRSLEELAVLAERAGLGPDEVDIAVDTGWASAAIVDYAAVHECGLIVMPAHSRRRPGLLGNTTDAVVRRATCPVLTLPPIFAAQEQAKSA